MKTRSPFLGAARRDNGMPSPFGGRYGVDVLMLTLRGVDVLTSPWRGTCTP